MSAASTGVETERTLASYDPFDPAVQEDPWHYYALLRREAPVYRDTHTGLFMVSSYALVTEVLKNWQVYSNRFARVMAGSRDEDPNEFPDGSYDRGWMPVDTMLTADPPAQKRFRSLVDGAFRLKRVRALEPRMRALAGELAAKFIDHGRVEFRAEFAVPLPLTIIAEQLGVPATELPTFKQWSDGFVKQLSGMATRDEQRDAARQILEFQRYFSRTIEARRAEPRDDIISDLVNARVEGERPLDMAESLSILQQLLVAGNETTASTICEAARLFAENPDQFEKLRANPGLIPNAVEEIVRHATPTSNMWRVTTGDTMLGGVEIAKGSMVMVRYAAANRDETVFPDPDRFDIERSNAREQLAFGLGIHYCLGAQLAKSEIGKAIEMLAERMSSIRIARDARPLRHSPNILLRGLTALPLEFDRA